MVTDQRFGHRPELDGLRGVAVGMVLLGHLDTGYFDQMGTAGVTVFFALSGYLITALLIDEFGRRDDVSFRHFYARRALRLMPAAAVVFAVFGIWALVDRTINAPVLWPALYLSDIAASARVDLGVFSHTWSLSVEEQFYLVWPLVFVLAWRRSARTALRMTLAGVAASWLCVVVIAIVSDRATSPQMSFGPHTNAYALLAGCALAIVGTMRHVPVGRLTFPAAIVIVAAGLKLVGGDAICVVVMPVCALATVVLIAGLADHDGWLRSALGLAPLRWVGRISYGLYLWHFPIFLVFRYRLGVSFPLRAAILVGLSIAVAAASHQWIERPFLRLKDRFRSDGHRSNGLLPVVGGGSAG